MAKLSHPGIVVIYNEHTARMIEVTDAILGYDRDNVITSGREGRHMVGSKHYEDKALDFRGRHLAEEQRLEKIEEIQIALGNGYKVLSSNHGAIHVQTA